MASPKNDLKRALAGPKEEAPPSKKRKETKKCSVANCEFFASTKGKCSTCSRGQPVKPSEEKQRILERKTTLPPLAALGAFPVKTGTTFKEFLVQLAEISKARGPGQRFVEQSCVCERRTKLSLVDTYGGGPPALRKVTSFAIHSIENEPDRGRFASVTFYMARGGRIKAGWMEEADGTVVVDTHC
jgi:hypothetical protein